MKPVYYQACETGDEGLVSDSAGRLLERVYDLCRQCGQVALASGAHTSMLDNEGPASISDLLSLESSRQEEDPGKVDVLNLKPCP